jgi:hypothetical protein
MTSYRITLTLRLEFWSPSITYLFSPHIKDVPKMEVPMDSTLIPIYADVFDYDDLELSPGWSMYSHACYQLDRPNDTVDIRPILKESIIQAIDYHIQNNIPLVNLIDVKVRKQGDLLRYGHDYQIDYGSKTIQFFNKEYGYYTYTIVIAIDTQYVNQLIKDVFHLA